MQADEIARKLDTLLVQQHQIQLQLQEHALILGLLKKGAMAALPVVLALLGYQAVQQPNVTKEVVREAVQSVASEAASE